MVLMGAIAGGALVIGVVLPVSRDRPPPRPVATRVSHPEQAPQLGEVGASIPPAMMRRIDLPEQQLSGRRAIALLSERSGTPISVVGDLDGTVELSAQGRRVLDVLDDVLGQLHADRRDATINGRAGYEVRVVGAR
jgi:hypothetical protein